MKKITKIAIVLFTLFVLVTAVGYVQTTFAQDEYSSTEVLQKLEAMENDIQDLGRKMDTVLSNQEEIKAELQNLKVWVHRK